MNLQHVMLDLETLDQAPTAAIVSIGAVKFDLDSSVLGSEFYEVVDAESCQRYGLTISAATVKWWMEKPEDSRRVFNSPSVALPVALFHFSEYLSSQREIVLWGNGATFDNMILRNAFLKTQLIAPWGSKRDFCFRTMKNMFPLDIEFQGTQHNSLDDAKHQARWLIELMKKMRS